ncbi:MAG: 16S rRNA (cytidine(1402)-2'-O)-methyltransferase [Candidatus Aminicenantes bacterium]|nr:16S rRNA (cytidine(1402)-2'-O)-methyltransferase [Candidatus Aminicenantes bacterium]
MALYIVPTPIGNLGDITRRAAEMLSRVDFVIAEDTRRTRKLLSHLGIGKRIVSHYRPKEETQADRIVAMLKKQDGALVSDSGTPGISDPGFTLVRKAIAAGIAVIPLPGPTAFVPALVASGIDPRRFLFLGFPPRHRGERRRFLKTLSPLPYTLVLYESPQRLGSLLQDAFAVLGDRDFALAREISKKHERIVRSRLGSRQAALQEETLLGEMVVVIAGSPGCAQAEEAPLLENTDDLYDFFRQRFGMGKNALKKILMKKRAKSGPGHER